MYTIPPKKLLIINILEILRAYSDADHRLSQKEIKDLLLKDFSMKADRKSIKRNIMDLIDLGYNIEYTEIIRNGKSGEETIYTDLYLERDFSDAELRMIIDSILFSKHIPGGQIKALVKKVEGLSSRYFDARVRHVRTLEENNIPNHQIFYTIEILDEAIEKKRQVEFSLNAMNINKERVVRTDENGCPRRFVFNPYQMAATNSRYYLIGNFDQYDDIAYVRLDHISDIRIRADRTKPVKQVKGMENGLDLPKHMAEHVYMLYGETVNVTLRAPKSLSDQLCDWFGTEFALLEDEGQSVVIRVRCSRRAMRFWALQFGTFVEVLEPQSLREDIIKSIVKMKDRYEVE